MHSGSDAFPSEALDDVAYLSRSANRVRILDALTRGPYTRRRLAELTEASRTTLDRIVNELEDRSWAERTPDGDYAATTEGAHLMQQFRPFIESVEAIQRLEGALEWLPNDELEVGLQHFSDASIRRPKRNDPVETVEYMTELVQDASEFRVLTHLTAPKALLEAIRDRVVSARLTLEVVTPTESADLPTEQSDRHKWWRDILESDADLYFCDGPIPCNLWIIDETVLIKKSRPGPIDESYGAPIVSKNDAVRSWGHDLIDRYRADATRVDLETLTESSVRTGDP